MRNTSASGNQNLRPEATSSPRRRRRRRTPGSRDDRTARRCLETRRSWRWRIRRHEVEEEQDRERARAERDPGPGKEVEGRDEARDAAPDDEELVLLPLDCRRLSPEPVPDDDVERQGEVRVDVRERGDVPPRGEEEAVVEDREGEGGADPESRRGRGGETQRGVASGRRPRCTAARREE